MGVIKRIVVTLSKIEDTIAVKKHNVLINGQTLPLVTWKKNINLTLLALFKRRPIVYLYFIGYDCQVVENSCFR